MKDLLEHCDKEQNMSVTGLLLLPVQKKTLKHSAQCHILAQSPPDRRPNDKYPVNTSHRSDLSKSFSLQYCLVATVIHIQSVRSQICVYIYIYIYIKVKVSHYWPRWAKGFWVG